MSENPCPGNAQFAILIRDSQLMKSTTNKIATMSTNCSSNAQTTANELYNSSAISSIVVTTQVKVKTDLIGQSNPQYYSNNAINCSSNSAEQQIQKHNSNNNRDRFNYNAHLVFPHNYSLLQVPQSPVLTKTHYRSQRFNHCFRSRHHQQQQHCFKRRLSTKWTNSSNLDAVSSISSSSGAALSCPLTDPTEKSPLNSNDNILLDSLSVENIPRLSSLSSERLNCCQMSVDKCGITTAFKDFGFIQSNPISVPSATIATSTFTKDEPLRTPGASVVDANPSKSDLNALAPCKGILNLTIICQFSRITILMKEAQNLQPTFHSSNSTSNLNNQCNSFLRIQLISCTPNIPNLTLYDSEIFPGTSIPLYDKSFSFDISPNDFQKRILISIFHSHDKELELLGCMSFGIKKFINKTQVSGWYYLLQPQIGSRKHLKAGQFSVSRIRSLSGANISGLTTTTVPMTTAGIGISGSSYFPASLDTASTALHTFEVKLMRGQKGFGFTLCGGSPVYVSNVDVDSSAEAAGIHPGDMVLRIDNFSVVESSTETVVRMFRMCPKTVKVTLSRSPVRLPVLCPSSNCCEKATPSSGLPTTRNLMLQQSAVTPRPLPTSLTTSPAYQSPPGTSGPSSSSVPILEEVIKNLCISAGLQMGWLPDKAKPPNPQAVTKKEGILCDCHIQSPIDKAQVPPLLPPPPNNSHQGNGHGSSHKLVMSSSHSFQNANIAVGAGCHTNYGRDIVSRLQYQGHLQKVDFGTLSNRLEVSGPVNLREGNSLFPVYVMLFPEVILIGQHEPDGRHITVIKEPIYCANICYVNIPALKRDELILQYINEVGRKQFVHFQSRNIREWLKHIQRHMVYHCNWWMKNVA